MSRADLNEGWVSLIGRLILEKKSPPLTRHKIMRRWVGSIACSKHFALVRYQSPCRSHVISRCIPLALSGHMQITSSPRCQVWVCGSLDGIAGSNPPGGMDVCLLWMLCFVRLRSLGRDDPSSRGVLPRGVCVTKCDCDGWIMGRHWLTRGCCAMAKEIWCHIAP